MNTSAPATAASSARTVLLAPNTAISSSVQQSLMCGLMLVNPNPPQVSEAYVIASPAQAVANGALLVSSAGNSGGANPSLSNQDFIAELTAAGVPCGSVRDVGEVLKDPQLAAREMIQQVEHAAAGAVSVLGVPIKLSESPGVVRTAPPVLGQHNEQVLRGELGLDDEAIQTLRQAGVI